MSSLKTGNEDIWNTNVAVPISQLPEMISKPPLNNALHCYICLEWSKQDCDHPDLFASVLGHIADENFHTAIMYDKPNPELRC